MGEKVLDWLGKIITGPKSRFFWAFIIVALVIGIIVFPYIDANFLYYDRIEKRINNLKALVELAGTPLQENEPSTQNMRVFLKKWKQHEKKLCLMLLTAKIPYMTAK